MERGGEVIPRSMSSPRTRGPIRRVMCFEGRCSTAWLRTAPVVMGPCFRRDDAGVLYKTSIFRDADGAVLAAFAPGSQADFFEKRPLALVDASEQVDAGFAAPVAHRLGAVKPADRLEAGDVAVRPFAGVDHVAEPSVENLVLARRLVRQIELGVGFAAGPSRVIGLDGDRQLLSDRLPGLGGFVRHHLSREVAAARETEFY